MFKFGVYQELYNPAYLFPGDYTVQGYYATAVNVANSTENYRFDTHADAVTALGNSDFVILQQSISAAGVNGIDMRGDAGGGTQASTSGAYAPGLAPFYFSRGSTGLVLPASIFPTGQSTRTGTVRGTNVSTVYFTFCSWNSTPASNQYYPGGYTINGHYLHASATNTAADYLFDSTADGYLSSSDFVLVMAEPLSGTESPVVFFDTRADAGAATFALTSGNRTSGEIIHKVSSVAPVCLPASIFPTGQSTRTGRIQSQTSTSNVDVCFTFCSWL